MASSNDLKDWLQKNVGGAELVDEPLKLLEERVQKDLSFQKFIEALDTEDLVLLGPLEVMANSYAEFSDGSSFGLVNYYAFAASKIEGELTVYTQFIDSREIVISPSGEDEKQKRTDAFDACFLGLQKLKERFRKEKDLNLQFVDESGTFLSSEEFQKRNKEAEKLKSKAAQ